MKAQLPLVARGDLNVYRLSWLSSSRRSIRRQYPLEETNGNPHGAIETALMEGVALDKLARANEARTAFERAKAKAEAALKQAPDDPARHKLLALALAHLGEKEAAIAEGKRAVALRPESRDAFEGPGYTAVLAEVYALTGENAKAIELLDGLLSRPSDLTVNVLKLDPAADPLRDDPAFKACSRNTKSRAERLFA